MRMSRKSGGNENMSLIKFSDFRAFFSLNTLKTTLHEKGTEFFNNRVKPLTSAKYYLRWLRVENIPGAVLAALVLLNTVLLYSYFPIPQWKEVNGLLSNGGIFTGTFLIFFYINFIYLKKINIISRILAILFSFTFGYLMLHAFSPVDITKTLKAENHSALAVHYIFGMMLLTSFILRLSTEAHERRFILYFSIPFLVFMVYYLAYFPGNMSVDSLNQWKQIIRNSYHDWHPAFHTVFMWLLTRIWFSPGVVSLFQVIFMAGVFAYGMAALENGKAPRSLLLAMTIFFALWPLNGIYSVTLWKDILYSGAILWLTILTIKIVLSHGEWLRRVPNIFHMIFVMTLVNHFRHNGLASVLAVILGMLLFYPRKIIPVVIIIAGVITTYSLVNGPFKKVFHVHGQQPGFAYVYTHQIAAVINAKGNITPDEYKIIHSIYRHSWWIQNYYPHAGVLMLDIPGIQKIEKIQNEYRKTWENIARRNPQIIIDHVIKSGSLAWKVTFPHRLYYVYCHLLGGNKMGLIRDSMLPGMKEFLTSSLKALDTKELGWFFYRAPLFLYISILFGFLFSIKNRTIRGLLPIFPGLANAMGIFLFAMGQDTRFMYPSIVIAPLLVGYYFTQWEPAEPVNQGDKLSPHGTSQNHFLLAKVNDNGRLYFYGNVTKRSGGEKAEKNQTTTDRKRRIPAKRTGRSGKNSVRRTGRSVPF